ncbi:uncharacterized protein [Phyllobates terribilis]|uniref:uncharacterized protein n=1 Tax=Phyllobates terribilis TaxID=111132 RepID=UPI003CCAA3DE
MAVPSDTASRLPAARWWAPYERAAPSETPLEGTGFSGPVVLVGPVWVGSADSNIDDSQDTSLLSAVIAMDVSYPKKEMVPSDNIETLDIQGKKRNVSETSKDGDAHIECKESISFIDEINTEDLLKMDGVLDGFTELIDDLSFLEMPEDGSGELSCALLEEINSMQHPQSLQSATEGCSMEGDHTDRQGKRDESVTHKREDYGLRIQKADKFIQNMYLQETPEETIVNEESTGFSPSLLNSFGCIPSDISHLFSVEEQSVTQKSFPVSNEKLTLNKGKNVSWNDASRSQTSLPCLEEVKPSSEVSKTTTCMTAAMHGITDEEQLRTETKEQQVLESVIKDCVLLMSQNNTDFEMDQQHKDLSKSPTRKGAQDTHLNENTRREEEEIKRGLFERTCKVSDSEELFQSTKSSTELMSSRSKNSTGWEAELNGHSVTTL